MNLTIYVWKIKSDQEREVLNSIVNNALNESSYELIELQNNPSIKQHSSNTLILCFGSRPFQIVSQINPGCIELPLLMDLIDRPSNQDNRIKAWEIIKRLKDPIIVIEQDSILELTPEDLSEKLQSKNLKLVKDQLDNNIDYWIGETLSGKKVLISNKHHLNTIECNFKLTTEELYAAKLAVEVLGLKSLVIVKKDKKDE